MSSLAYHNNPFQLPSQYIFLEVLGEGGFGKVLTCYRKENEDIVAVKIPLYHDDDTAIKEVAMLKNLMLCNLDQHNIVKFLDSFDVHRGKALVFEALDINIEKYIFMEDPVPMSDIRVIIKQVATALDALDSIGVIHTDIKTDNIMLVNRKRPLKVKLIDFGLAMPRFKAKQGMTLQTVFFRSPEIILGLPFFEAIDMWALGNVMAAMMLRSLLFPGKDEYEALHFIVELLGQPADHLLNEGKKTVHYFNRTQTNSWRLKTPQEYRGKYYSFRKDFRRYKLDSLDCLTKVHVQNRKTDTSEWRNCIELLKAMLKMDADERITPSEVLNHPFIAEDCPKSLNDTSTSAATQSFTRQVWTRPTVPTELDWSCFDESSSESSSEITSPLSPPSSSPPHLLQSATATDNLQKDNDVQCDIVHVSSESYFSLLTHLNKLRSEVSAYENDDTTNIQPNQQSPSPTITQSVVIMVRPAPADKRVDLVNEDSATSVPTHVTKMSRSEASDCLSERSDCDLPSPLLKDEDTTDIQSDQYSPPPTRTVVIMVRPAPANNRVDLTEQDSETSMSFGEAAGQHSERQRGGAEPVLTVPMRLQQRLSLQFASEDSITSDDARTTKKKQKRNCFRRALSWMKKNCCCWNRVEED